MTATQNGVGTSASASLVVTPARAITAGSLLQLAVTHQGGAISSVVDNNGTSWTLSAADSQAVAAATSQKRVQICYLQLAPGQTITSVTIAGSGAVLLAQLIECTGQWNLVTTNATSVSTTNVPTPLSGAQPGDLGLCVLGYFESTAGSRQDAVVTTDGYAEIANISLSTTAQTVQYKFVTASGTTTPTFTMGSGSTGTAATLFRPASTNVTEAPNVAAVAWAGTAPSLDIATQVDGSGPPAIAWAGTVARTTAAAASTAVTAGAAALSWAGTAVHVTADTLLAVRAAAVSWAGTRVTTSGAALEAPNAAALAWSGTVAATQSMGVPAPPGAVRSFRVGGVRRRFPKGA